MKKMTRGIREVASTLFVFAILFSFYLVCNANIK